jgi:hypothetical protein
MAATTVPGHHRTMGGEIGDHRDHYPARLRNLTLATASESTSNTIQTASQLI